MDKKHLISKVMTEVKDEELREELLRALAKDKGDDSALLEELSRLGFDPEGSREFISFSAKAGAFVGMAVSVLFAIAGVVMFFTPAFPMGIFFVAIGGFFIVYHWKLLKALMGG